jgi:hypothetical protein
VCTLGVITTLLLVAIDPQNTEFVCSTLIVRPTRNSVTRFPRLENEKSRRGRTHQKGGLSRRLTY